MIPLVGLYLAQLNIFEKGVWEMSSFLSVGVVLCVVILLFLVPPLSAKINVIGTTEGGSGWYLGVPPCTTWSRLGGLEYIPAYHQLGYNVQWDYRYELPVTFRNASHLPIWVTLSSGSVPPWGSLSVDRKSLLLMPGQEAMITMRFSISSDGFDELPDLSIGGDMILRVLSISR